MSKRADLRALARQALAASQHLQGVKQISAWAGNISATELPVLGVVTPQETVQAETLSHFMRGTLLQVVLKRLGTDDLEDRLDEDADAIEIAICAAFGAARLMCVPEKVSFVLNGEGEQRIGTVMADFRVSWHRTLQGSTL